MKELISIEEREQGKKVPSNEKGSDSRRTTLLQKRTERHGR